jgi:hypothetical protein
MNAGLTFATLFKESIFFEKSGFVQCHNCSNFLGQVWCRLNTGLVVQLVRIHACHAWGRGFESRPDRFFSNTKPLSNEWLLLFYRIYNHNLNFTSFSVFKPELFVTVIVAVASVQSVTLTVQLVLIS